MPSYKRKETPHTGGIDICQDWTIRAEHLPSPEQSGELLLHLFQNRDVTINPNSPVPPHTLDLIALHLLHPIVNKNQLTVLVPEDKWVVTGQQPSHSYVDTRHTPVILAGDFRRQDSDNIDTTVSKVITVSPDRKIAHEFFKPPDRGILFAFNTNNQMICLYSFAIPQSKEEAARMSKFRPFIPIVDFTNVRSIVNAESRTLPNQDVNSFPAIKLWGRDTLDIEYFTLTATLALGMTFGPLLDTLHWNNLGR